MADSRADDAPAQIVGAGGIPSAEAVGTPTVRVHHVLLRSARLLHDDGYYAAAILASQTAAEVFLERALVQMFEAHRADRFWDDVAAFIPNFNLHPGNQRLRRLYVTLSDDHGITKQPFWNELGEHVQRRNKIAHEGQDATHDDSRASYRAVDQLITHVERVLDRVLQTTKLADRGP